MIPAFKLAHAHALAACLLLVGLAGCEILKKSEEVQDVVNKRVVGMQAGNFFDRYGPAYRREEQSDGTTVYLWVFRTGPVAAGYLSPDEHTCSMRLIVDKRGKIATADVTIDNTGHTSLSRCSEIFNGAP